MAKKRGDSHLIRDEDIEVCFPDVSEYLASASCFLASTCLPIKPSAFGSRGEVKANPVHVIVGEARPKVMLLH